MLNATATTVGMLTPPSSVEFFALIPGGIAAFAAILVMFLEVFHRGKGRREYQAYVGSVVLGLGLLLMWALWDNTISEPLFHGMLYFDQFTLLMSGLIYASGIAALLMSPDYLVRHSMDRSEYYMLLLFSVSGGAVVIGSADLITFFLGFEVLSIPVYVLAGFLRQDEKSAEACMKYFILGAFSAALMLYGIALIYGVTGTTNLEFIGQHLGQMLEGTSQAPSSLVVVGVLLVLSGLAFKVSSVPFHLWTPDVYTGSPTPAVGFMASAVKAAAFAALLRIFFLAFDAPLLRGGFFGYGWVDVLFFISAASMILGNLVAITQTNVKRMLAYSSIAHAGYILLGVTAAAAKPEFFAFNSSVVFYLFAYSFGIIGAFGIIAWFSKKGRDVQTYSDLNGLGTKYPLLGFCMGVFMFSSAGVPPTGGFFGKLYLFRAAVSAGAETGEMAFIGLSVIGVLTSVAGIYYYLRVLVHMYMREGGRSDVTPIQNAAGTTTIVACAAIVLYLGVFPRTFVDASEASVEQFSERTTVVQSKDE